MPRRRSETWRGEDHHGIGPGEEGGHAVENNGTDHLRENKISIACNKQCVKVEIGSLRRERDNLLCRGGGHSVENNPNKVCVV